MLNNCMHMVILFFLITFNALDFKMAFANTQVFYFYKSNGEILYP